MPPRQFAAFPRAADWRPERLVDPEKEHVVRRMIGRTRLKAVFSRGEEAVVSGLRHALRLGGFRSLNISYPHRIGHLVLEADSFLRDRMVSGPPPRRHLLLEPDGGFANLVVAEYLSRYFIVVRRSRWSRLLKLAFEREGLIEDTAPHAVAMYQTARCFAVYERWGARPPLFELTRSDVAHRAAALKNLGVPDDAWFVCVHARGGGYSPSDEFAHSYRNVPIEDYGPAMDRIVERGGWCIRMGDPTMEPMPTKRNCVDYALSPVRSARLDVVLSASCRFFLSCSSGLYNVAAMFGRPSALANTAPLAASYSQGVADLAIPQRMRDAQGRLMSFDEVFASGIAQMRLTSEFTARYLRPTNVTPGEIADLVGEMLDRLDGRAEYTAEDEERQARFRSYFRDGHYAFGAGSRIGRDFLRAHMADLATNL